MWENYLSPIPGVGKMIHSFLHPEEGYDAAAKQMQNYWQQAQQQQQPYNQAGQQQINTLNQAQSNLLYPSKLLGDWMSKYQTSPYAQKSMENARQSGLDAASSMGLLGSSAALQNIQNSSSDIMNKDRDTYLQDLMQKYLAGTNIGQNIYNTGAQTAANLGTQGQAMGQNMAGTAFGQQNAPGQLFNNLLQMAIKALAPSGGGAAGIGNLFGQAASGAATGLAG